MDVQTNSGADQSTSPDLPDLPPDLLALTAKRLTSVYDYVSFRGVCDSWRFAATFENFDRSFPQVPWLMYTIRPESNKSVTTKFFDLLENTTFAVANFPVHEKRKKYFSCNGWILAETEGSVRIYLTHPVSSIRIELPDLDTLDQITCTAFDSKQFFKSVISKMVLSGSPMVKSDFVIMVIWGEKKQLGFARPGDSSWTVMESWDGSFMDILYHKGKLYAIDDKHRVVECDIHGSNPTRVQQILSLSGFNRSSYQINMVESSGKLLIVLTVYSEIYFRVFECDLKGGSHKEIYDLGNRTLFVSPSSSSLCLEGSAWNDEIEPNCIYDAKTGKSFYFHEVFFEEILDGISPCTVSPPTWVVPYG